MINKLYEDGSITKVVMKSGNANKPNTPNKNDFKNGIIFVSKIKNTTVETATSVIPVILFFSFCDFLTFFGSLDKL